eukprot:6173121-Pleurochrysis_carterae.AAC.1
MQMQHLYRASQQIVLTKMTSWTRLQPKQQFLRRAATRGAGVGLATAAAVRVRRMRSRAGTLLPRRSAADIRTVHHIPTATTALD